MYAHGFLVSKLELLYNKHMSKGLDTICAWGNSEGRRDPHFSDLARIRLTDETLIDETQLSLAVRYPFVKLSELAEKGCLGLPEYQASAREVSDILLDIGDRIFGTYSTLTPDRQKAAQPELTGYYAELSFYLLMLRTAQNHGIITLPSRIDADIRNGVAATGSKLNYDAIVLGKEAPAWQPVQIKASDSPKTRSYHHSIRVICPPILPLERDKITQLPLNVFFNFIDMKEAVADVDTVHAVNAQAVSLAKYVLSQ